MSHISFIHYMKLIIRSCLFLGTAAVYIFNRVTGTGHLLIGSAAGTAVMLPVWLMFTLEMILRFFPSRFESMGCQKQFRRNFDPSGKETARRPKRVPVSILFVALFWVLLNGIFGALYYANIFDEGIMILISLAYSVCDMICILFFCPFQTWFMKNKCCTSCRIYNWDYAMMFTPLIFIKNFFTLSILFFAVILLLRWEITAYLHPERFSEETNACLSCKNCEEKLCHHKKQLKQFLRTNSQRFNLYIDSRITDLTERSADKKEK